MGTTDNIQKELLELDWQDFRTYPRPDQRLMIHAEGYDTKERVQKHCFFELEHFNIMDFPTDEMQKTLKQHHCKWNYKWLPAKT